MKASRIPVSEISQGKGAGRLNWISFTSDSSVGEVGKFFGKYNRTWPKVLCETSQTHFCAWLFSRVVGGRIGLIQPLLRPRGCKDSFLLTAPFYGQTRAGGFGSESA